MYDANDDNGKGQVRTCDRIVTIKVENGRFLQLCKLNEPVDIDESTVRLELNSDDSIPSPSESLVTMGTASRLQDTPYSYNANLSAKFSTDGLFAAGDGKTGFCDSSLEVGSPVVQVKAGGVHTLVGSILFCGGDKIPRVGRTSVFAEDIKDKACKDLNSVGSFCETPSEHPTSSPSSWQSNEPTTIDTIMPSFHPSQGPSMSPSVSPSRFPSNSPSSPPTSIPTSSPTDSVDAAACRDDNTKKFKVKVKGVDKKKKCKWAKTKKRCNKKLKTPDGDKKKVKHICPATCGKC